VVVLSLVVKRPEREADHSTPPSVEVKNMWIYSYTPPIRLYGVVWLVKHRETFHSGISVFWRV